MKFLINGSASTATLFRFKTIRVAVLNDDGSPFSLAGQTAILNLYLTVSQATPSYSLKLTPDGSLGVYGIGTIESPSIAGLTSGSSWYAKLQTDDGTLTAGKVVSVTLSTNGLGYRDLPTFTADGQGMGTGCVLTGKLTKAPVASTSMVLNGSGYDSANPPVVTVSGGSPSAQAVFTANVSGPILTTSVFADGRYAATPTATASDGQGAVLTPVMIASSWQINVNTPGSGYTNGYQTILPGAGVTGYVLVSSGQVQRVDILSANPSANTSTLTWGNMGSGTGATFTFNQIRGGVGNNSFAGFSSSQDHWTVFGNLLSWSGQTSYFSQVWIYRSQAGTLKVAVVPSGVSGTTNYTATVVGGPFGGGVTLQMVVVSGVVTAVNVTAGTISPLTFYGVSGSVSSTYEVSTYYLQPADTNVYFNYRGIGVISITTAFPNDTGYAGTKILTPGAGMTSVPSFAWTLTDQGVDSNLTAGLSLVWASVQSLTVSAGGIGYKSTSTISFSGGGVIQTATGAVLSIDGQVTGLTTVYAGSNYQSAPTITIAPPSAGTQATALANLSTTLASIDVTTQGSNYYKQPQLVASGGSPTTAAVGTIVLGHGVQQYSSNFMGVVVE